MPKRICIVFDRIENIKIPALTSCPRALEIVRGNLPIGRFPLNSCFGDNSKL